jgi:hypothetical protein
MPSESITSNAPTALLKALRRSFFRVLSFSKSAVLTVALIVALALNIATLTFMPVFNMLSSAIGAVAGLMTNKPATIRSKHRGKIESLNAEHTKKQSSEFQWGQRI